MKRPYWCFASRDFDDDPYQVVIRTQTEPEAHAECAAYQFSMGTPAHRCLVFCIPVYSSKPEYHFLFEAVDNLLNALAVTTQPLNCGEYDY